MTNADLKKRYWVFDVHVYEPNGGLYDISLTTDNLDVVKKEINILNKKDADFYSYYVFDSVERSILKDVCLD